MENIEGRDDSPLARMVLRRVEEGSTTNLIGVDKLSFITGLQM
jgi:hypothetical protein